MTDDEQLRALFDQMCQTWTAGDAAAYGRCFTSDCDYVSFDGYHERGREAMVASHDKLFRGVLFGSALVGQVESIRHLGDGIAVVHATGSVLVAWRKRLPKRRLTRNTIVAVRGPEGWRCAAIHNGRVRPVGVPAPDSVPARVARGLVRTSRVLHLGHTPAAPPPGTVGGVGKRLFGDGTVPTAFKKVENRTTSTSAVALTLRPTGAPPKGEVPPAHAG